MAIAIRCIPMQCHSGVIGIRVQTDARKTVDTVLASREAVALERAVEYVELLEERYHEQQMRLRCEGCGE